MNTPAFMWILLVANVIMATVGVFLLVADIPAGLSFIVVAAILVWRPMVELRRMRRESKRSASGAAE